MRTFRLNWLPVHQQTHQAHLTPLSAILSLHPLQHLTHSFSKHPPGREQGDKPRRSSIWQHFHIQEEPRVPDCLLCERKISRGNVIGHLSNASIVHHPRMQHCSALLQAKAGHVSFSGFLSPTEAKPTVWGKPAGSVEHPVQNWEGRILIVLLRIW